MSSSRRCGLTVLELLVSVAVIGILVTLLISAVYTVRASAERARCANNLKQFGVALHSYQSAVGVFPPGAMVGPAETNHDYPRSVHVLLLAHLGHQELYDSVNFSLHWGDPNHTAIFRRMSGFLCPSQPIELEENWHPSNNYSVSAGVLVYSQDDLPSNALEKKARLGGPFLYGPSTRLADVRDGAASTAAVIERTFTSNPKERSPRQYMAFHSSATPSQWPGCTLPATNLTRGCSPLLNTSQLNGFRVWVAEMDAVLANGDLATEMIGRGGSWYMGRPQATIGHTLYPPNSHHVDGMVRGQQPGDACIFGCIDNPRSFHSGGANILMLDGRVVFVSDGTSESIMWAMGTIANNETDSLAD